MNDRIGPALTISMAAVLVLSPLALLGPLRGSPDAAERRQLVNLTRPERDAVRAEMRQMLASVDGVVRAVSTGDLAATEAAARASGMATAVDPRLERKLPKAFLEMGERVHHGFDELADAAKTNASRDALLAKLADVTGTCVACHAVYRFVGTR